ncbi:YrbL family protein, partial [Aliarcobacter butzleri]
GYEQTNLGKATVFELIRDDDGKISQEMDKFLDNNSVDDIEKILKYLPLLKKYIFDNKIYVKDLNPVNVMYQIKKKSNRLVIIDGLAHSNYNPFFYICDFFIMNKI